MKKQIFIISAILAFLAAANCVRAESPLELVTDDPIFNVANAAPGQVFSSPVTLFNHGDNREIFQFEIDIKTNPENLAEHLFFKVADGGGNCLWGCTGDINLASLDRKEPDIAEVGPHSTTNYNFILTFDPGAGNEFQDTLTTFDMKLGFEGTTTTANGGGGNGPGGGPGISGATFNSLLTGSNAGEETSSEGAVAGESTPAGGEVEGASTEACQGWPKWVWIVLLIAYFAAFLGRTFEKIKEQIEKREIRWKAQAVLAAVAFLVWYFGDTCRQFQWFAIAAILGGAVIYLAYLSLFRR